MKDLSRSNYAVNDYQEWQADYAAHGIATFPVSSNKKPMVKHYSRFGLVGSTNIARRFADAPAIGLMCGKRNRLTVLDVDTADERVLADAVDRHGKTPIVIRTGSGHFQAWYRHGGERRLIRPRPDVPIDILGGGLVVAPPSRVAKGSYEFIQGSLDDLDSLPTLNDAPSILPTEFAGGLGDMREGSGRNNKLFRLCLHGARLSDHFDQLLDYAVTKNNQFGQPMEDKEVMRAASSAWRYETEGRNYIGGMRAVFSVSDMLPLMPDPYVAALVVWAKANFKPDGHFWLADGLAEKFGWSRKRLKEVRKRAVERGIFRLVRRAGFKRPAVYCWGLRELSPRGEGVH
jgi:hypothetical protein